MHVPHLKHYKCSFKRSLLVTERSLTLEIIEIIFTDKKRYGQYLVIDCQSLTSHLVTQLRKTLLFRMKLIVFVSVLVSLITLGLCQGPGKLSYEFCSVGNKDVIN